MDTILYYTLIMTCISRFNDGRKGRGADTIGDEIGEFVSTYFGVFVISSVIYLLIKLIIFVLF